MLGMHDMLNCCTMYGELGAMHPSSSFVYFQMLQMNNDTEFFRILQCTGFFISLFPSVANVHCTNSSVSVTCTRQPVNEKFLMPAA